MLGEPRLELMAGARGPVGSKVWTLNVRLRHGGFIQWAKGDFQHFEARVSHDQIYTLETDGLGIFIFNKYI